VNRGLDDRGQAASQQRRRCQPARTRQIIDDAAELLTFFDYPAEHWLHLKTSNPITSPLEA